MCHSPLLWIAMRHSPLMWISGESSGKNVPGATGRPGGFTLVEILGVMAIIATLTAGPRIVSETSHVDELLMKTTYL